MSANTPFANPVRMIVVRFLALCAAAIVVAAAQGAGLLDAFAEKRALGLLIGIMALVVGNFLPKVRPLQGWLANAPQARTAERFAGWTLVLVGIVDIPLFAFAPLYQARLISGIVGSAAILLIAAGWLWFASRPASETPQPADSTIAISQRSAKKRRLLASLLFAFFWMLACACAVFLFEKQPWFSRSGPWMTAAIWLPYAAFTALLSCKRSPRTHLATR